LSYPEGVPNSPPTEELAALLIAAPRASWVEELAAMPTMAERGRHRAEALAQLEIELRRKLSGLPVEIERLDGIGGWAVRGRPSIIAKLRDQNGPLTGSQFEIAPDDTFYAIGR
jgi:hypothetical protein